MIIPKQALTTNHDLLFLSAMYSIYSIVFHYYTTLYTISFARNASILYVIDLNIPLLHIFHIPLFPALNPPLSENIS